MIDFYSTNRTRQAELARTPAKAQGLHITSHVSPWLGPLAYLLGRHFLLPLFFRRIKIIGQENIPRSGPVILSPTHRARWDALLVPYAAMVCRTRKDLRFMVTSTECQGLQGWFVRRLGGFPVNPQNPSIRTLRHGVELLLQKKTLVIFPEGNIYRDGELHPLKPGISRLALSAELSRPGLGVKVIPINIHYSQPYPNWGTDVIIHIAPAIQVSDYIDGCVKQNAQHLTADLTRVLQQLSHQESEITNHRFAEIPNS
jgi:1-acyl-sn-glycerol-3-phosphate acyltransferase